MEFCIFVWIICNVFIFLEKIFLGKMGVMDELLLVLLMLVLGWVCKWDIWFLILMMVVLVRVRFFMIIFFIFVLRVVVRLIVVLVLGIGVCFGRGNGIDLFLILKGEICGILVFFWCCICGLLCFVVIVVSFFNFLFFEFFRKVFIFCI